MKLIVHELNTSLSQVVSTPEQHVNIVAVRPHLVRYNFPTGTLKIQILDFADTVVAESDELDIADIGTMDYFHGYVRFDLNAYVTKNDSYTIKLVAGGGYTFSESAYIAWANGFDLAKYDINGTPESHYDYPFDYEIWEKTVR